MAVITSPVWVRKQDNGCFALCGEADAQGIVVDGTVYHVAGRSEIEGAETVNVGEISESAYQKEQQTLQSSLVYAAQASVMGVAIKEDEQKIRVSALYPDWKAGNHTQGEVYNAGGQTWECYQAYDNGTYPDIVPDNPSWYTFNRPLHGKSPETARPFVPVQGAHDMYHAGEYMIWTDGAVYRCKQDTNFSPEDYAQAWEKWEG